MSQPDLSVIIVNWNVRELLRDCLAALARQSLAASRFEAIVVDNASADGSAEMVWAEFPEVRLIASGANLGFAPGCQLGYAEAAGRHILLLNPDTAPPPGALAQMLADFEAAPDAGVMGSRLLNTDGSFQRAGGGAFPSLGNLFWNYAFLDRLLPGLGPKPLFMRDGAQGVVEQDWVSGAALMFRREAVGEVIFDPDYFMFGEDMDLCARVRDGGWRVLYSARQSILHHHGKSFAAQPSAAIRASVYKGPRLFFAARHGRAALFAYDAILLFGYLVRWPLFALASLIRPGRRHGEMARFSRLYVFTMLRLMWGANSARQDGGPA